MAASRMAFSTKLLSIFNTAIGRNVYSALIYTTHSRGNYTTLSEHVKDHLLLLLCVKADHAPSAASSK